MARIVVIGGGVAGGASALELADAGHEVILIESREDLLSGSSDNTPCRLGIGLHYRDFETALLYLESTINFLKKHKGYVVGQDDPVANYHLMHGRYYIVKEADKSKQTDPADILDIYKRLREAYKQKIAEDPDNKVLGEPEDFYRALTLDQYEKDVDPKKVVLGLETAEQTLDWPRFKKDYIEKIKAHPRIKIFTNTHVDNLKQKTDGSKAGPRFTTVASRGLEGNKETVEFTSDILVNAAWENIEVLYEKLGIPYPKGTRTNRAKVMIEIELPEDFRKKHSAFFCFGAYCSFTNIGLDSRDGKYKGFLTYEPITNVKDGMSHNLEITDVAKHLLWGKASAEEKAAFAEGILKGASAYLPGIEKATYLSTKFGNVRTKGKVDIYSPTSEHNKRNYSGVARTQIVGAQEAASSKLLHFELVAKEVRALVEQDLLMIETSQEFAKSASNKSLNKSTFENIIRSFADQVFPWKERTPPSFLSKDVEQRKVAAQPKTTAGTVTAPEIVPANVATSSADEKPTSRPRSASKPKDSVLLQMFSATHAAKMELVKEINSLTKTSNAGVTQEKKFGYPQQKVTSPRTGDPEVKTDVLTKVLARTSCA